MVLSSENFNTKNQQMLDLGLWKISLGGVFPNSSPCRSSNPMVPYPNPFPNAGGAKLKFP